MSTRSLIAALLGAAVLGGAQPAAADEPCRRGAVCRTAIPVTPNLALPIYALWPLGRSNPTIRRLVIVIHGSRRNAGSYFRRMNRAAREAGVEAETQVIAPHFRIAGDDGVTGERLLYWDRGADWKQGDDSALFPGGAVGSFAALDRMRAWLARMRLYPNLGRVLIAGHSAGGQFVQRYAMGSAAAPDGPTVPVRYVVANPSSYMYLDGRRPDGKGDFAENRGSARCLVNAYKYGPEGRNDYMAAEPLDAMVRRYRMRDVVYLLGGADSDPRGKGLDRSCPAMAQGPHRLARALGFKAYMDRFFAPHAHRLVRVPGVGHSSNRLFRSRQGRSVLFGD
ncbi:MAG: alpha/beta hydrolase [Alphaproteobacteria bacterium]|nr:alpha/beta hydrolase [Alphaproteobacteria bacterium]